MNLRRNIRAVLGYAMKRAKPIKFYVTPYSY